MSAPDLGREGARALVLAALDGRLDEVSLAEQLLELAARGETDAEVLGGAEALRERMLVFEHDYPDAVDTAGTGGDGLSSFNLSTAAALVAAAAGATVIKHGNRASSSKSGSADLLEALGLELDLAPDAARRVLDEVGITFLFAPRYHPAMAAVASLRRRLGVPTLFNLLGPLCNPAGVRRQLVGVAAAHRMASHARALETLGAHRALVVHGAGGADELTLAGPNRFVALDSTAGAAPLEPGSLDAKGLGLTVAPVEALAGGDAHRNVELLQRLLAGEASPIADATCLNAAATLWIAGVAESPADGLERAQQAIVTGAAARKLEAWLAAARRAKTARTNLVIPDRLVATLRSVEARRTGDEALVAPLPVPERREAFLRALSGPGIRIIAECKRRSPSRGSFETGPHTPLDIAARVEAYAEGGASALSILTEQDHFAGHPRDLAAASSAGLPRLRKDFLIDVGMVRESIAMGADAVLLIAACLTDERLAELRAEAGRLGLAVLVEAHDAAELERALAVAPDCLGINARNLTTFEVDLERALELVARAASAPDKPLIVAESGILTRRDLLAAQDAGADAALIGEALMKAGDPARRLQELLGAARVS